MNSFSIFFYNCTLYFIIYQSKIFLFSNQYGTRLMHPIRVFDILVVTSINQYSYSNICSLPPFTIKYKQTNAFTGQCPRAARTKSSISTYVSFSFVNFILTHNSRCFLYKYWCCWSFKIKRKSCIFYMKVGCQFEPKPSIQSGLVMAYFFSIHANYLIGLFLCS